MPKMLFTKAMARKHWKSKDGKRESIEIATGQDEWKFSSDGVSFGDLPTMTPLDIEMDVRWVNWSKDGRSGEFIAVESLKFKPS